MKTILVVDDMPLCRELIADALESRGFNAICASSGADAISVLESHHVDLILLDMNMPRMNGLTLLWQIRNDDRWKDIPVFVVTGEAQESFVRTAVQLGIQGYMLKSNFSSRELLVRVCSCLNVNTVPAISPLSRIGETAHATAIRAVTPSGRVYPANVSPAAPVGGCAAKSATNRKAEILQAVRSRLDLRPVPPVFHFVMSQVGKSDTSLQDMVQTLQQDPALSLRVMKVANSSLYTTGRAAKNLTEAAGRLGMSGIRTAVASVIVMSHFEVAAESGLIPQRFWEHSLGTAALAQALADELMPSCSDELFLAGLLHDVGRLFLSGAFPVEYSRVLDSAAEREIDLGSAERDAFGLGHSDITRVVLEHVGVSESVINAAAMHERDARQLCSAGEDSRKALIVAAANCVAHAMLLGDSGNAMLMAFDDHAAALQLRSGEMARLAHATLEKIRDTQQFYACRSDIPFRPPLARELARSVGRPPRVAVVEPDESIGPVTLMCEQLGWLHADDADTVVLIAPAEDKLRACEAQIASLHPRCAKPLNIVAVVSPAAPASELLCGLAPTVLGMPVHYSALLRALRSAPPPLAEASVAAEANLA